MVRAMARIKLQEYIQTKRNGRQTEIELSDGTILRVDPLELWNDDVLTYARSEPVRAAEALLGSEDYAKFKADGGVASLLLKMLTEAQGVTPGEASPSPS